MSRGRFARFAPVEDTTWANLGTGAYDGQVKRVIDVGNKKFRMEWDSTDAKWYPLNGKVLYQSSLISVTNSTGTQTLNLPTVSHPANFWGTNLGFEGEFFSETSISATGRTVNCWLGALGNEDFVAIPTAATRRTSMRFGFNLDGDATHQISWIKKDNNEYDGGGQSANSNATPMTRDTTAAISVGGNITYTTAASAATAKARVNYYLVRKQG